MKYTADYLINKRKEKWEELHDIDYDKSLREAIASQLYNDTTLLNEVKKYPEKFIELVFIVVDKDQTTKPFFLHDVQKEFINILNKRKSQFSLYCNLIDFILASTPPVSLSIVPNSVLVGSFLPVPTSSTYRSSVISLTSIVKI